VTASVALRRVADVFVRAPFKFMFLPSSDYSLAFSIDRNFTFVILIFLRHLLNYSVTDSVAAISFIFGFTRTEFQCAA